MKKSFAIVLGLMVFSLGAFGSKARINSLGGLKTGDRYFNDSQRIFYNPAAINENADMAILEWGTAATGVTDSATAPKAEGGFLKSTDNFVYGAYFGRTTNDDFTTRLAANATDRSGTVLQTFSFARQDNPFEVFVGGDMGIMWGASLRYANGSQETALTSDNTKKLERKNSAFDLNLGVIAGALELYADLGISDKSEVDSTSDIVDDKSELKGNFGFTLGGLYNWEDLVFFAEYGKRGYEYKRRDGTLDVEDDQSNFHLGLGHIMRIDSTAKMFFDLRYTSTKWSGTSGKSNTSALTRNLKTDTSVWTVPVTAGFEAQVKDWLALRGFVKHALFSGMTDRYDRDSTVTNQTDVGAGATLSFGKLKIDGEVGTTNLTNAAAETGVLSLGTALTRVAVVYHF